MSTSAWSLRNFSCLSAGYRALVNLAICCSDSELVDPTARSRVADLDATKVVELGDIALDSYLYLLTLRAIVSRIP